MVFVDYYAVLDISREATEKEINNAFFKLSETTPAPEIFAQAMEGREILTSKRERAAYDKSFGYSLVIQTQSAPLKNSQCYVLTRPAQAHIILLALSDDFKNWISQKTGLEWSELQNVGYHCDLFSHPTAPYLTLRFQDEKNLSAYAKKLMEERKIKK